MVKLATKQQASLGHNYVVAQRSHNDVALGVWVMAFALERPEYLGDGARLSLVIAFRPFLLVDTRQAHRAAPGRRVLLCH